MQQRIHDYHSPRRSADLNRKFVDLVPPGVYRGFSFRPDGTLDPGVLVTPEGVRIEETEGKTLTIPPNDSGFPRLDLVVCIHESLPSIPPMTARFEIVPGVSGDSPLPPAVPDHAWVLSIGGIEAGATTYLYVLDLGFPERLINCERSDTLTINGFSYRVVRGDRAVSREGLDGNSGSWKHWVIPAGTYQDGETIVWQNHRPLSVPVTAVDIGLLDTGNRFSAMDVETALQELAGAGRTTQTVKGNADAISTEATSRQEADGDLSQRIESHENSSQAHNAADISLADTGNRYSGTNVEAALQEIAGAGRTTQTVKGNADAIANHIGNASNAHGASAVSTEAIGGSPLNLPSGNVQSSLSTLLSSVNDRARKTGDTFSGAVTFQNRVTFDADDVDDIAFDDEILFVRTLSAFSGRGMEGMNPAPFNDTFGCAMFSDVGHHVLLPIQGIAASKLSKVRFYVQVQPGTTGRATVTLRVSRTPSFYAGDAGTPTTVMASHTLQTGNPANPDATSWTTLMHELDLGDYAISAGDFTQLFFASILLTEAAGKAVIIPGVKVAYTRTRLVV